MFSKRDSNQVYMAELCEMIDRTPVTVHKWIKVGRLNGELRPVKGWGDNWVWTRAQANAVAKLAKEIDRSHPLDISDAAHRLGRYKDRLPRKLKHKHIVIIRKAIPGNRSRDEIAEELMPIVTYTTVDALDKAIVAMCLHEGFPVPPRYLGHHELMAARAMQRHGYSLQGIVNALYRRTMYTHHVELEGDLVRAYELRDWDLPPSDPNVKWIDKLTPRQRGEIRRLEKQLEAVERLLDK